MEDNIWFSRLLSYDTLDGSVDVELMYHETREGFTWFDASFIPDDNAEYDDGEPISKVSFSTAKFRKNKLKENSTIVRIANSINTFLPADNRLLLTTEELIGFIDESYEVIADLFSKICSICENSEDIERDKQMFNLMTFDIASFCMGNNPSHFVIPNASLKIKFEEESGLKPTYEINFINTEENRCGLLTPVKIMFGSSETYGWCLAAVTNLIIHNGRKITKF